MELKLQLLNTDPFLYHYTEGICVCFDLIARTLLFSTSPFLLIAK